MILPCIMCVVRLLIQSHQLLLAKLLADPSHKAIPIPFTVFVPFTTWQFLVQSASSYYFVVSLGNTDRLI